MTRNNLILLAVILLALNLNACAKQDGPGAGISTIMPGQSFAGQLPPLSDSEVETAENLKKTVKILSEEIGERNTKNPENLEKSARYLESVFREYGYQPQRNSYEYKSVDVSNIYVVKSASRKTDRTIVIGAHYDSLHGTVGANDNASGVAVLLELARMLKTISLEANLHFVGFVNEEPPYFQTADMGSVVYAKRLRQQRIKVIAMYSLETMGAYYDDAGSQSYPFPLDAYYPDVGNFIAFVSNPYSKQLLEKSIKQFREMAVVPSEGLSAPEVLEGVSWSDHWSFWQEGYPAVMITDTAPFRYEHYHKTSDSFDKIDYQRMSRVTHGIAKMIQKIAK